MLKNIKKSWKFQIPDVGPKLILRILLFLQFAGAFFVYLNVYDYFPMTKIEVFPQQVHSTWNVGNTAARTQSHGQEGCSCSAIEVLFRKLPSLSETRRLEFFAPFFCYYSFFVFGVNCITTTTSEIYLEISVYQIDAIGVISESQMIVYRRFIKKNLRTKYCKVFSLTVILVGLVYKSSSTSILSIQNYYLGFCFSSVVA